MEEGYKIVYSLEFLSGPSVLLVITERLFRDKDYVKIEL